jgi:hypothetical protein
MDTSDIIALVGLGIAVILGIGAILGARRWGTRPGRLLFDHDATSLVPQTAGPSGLLQLTFRDVNVPEPHLVRVRLVNVGPRDIATAHFDNGTPLSIDLGCTLYGVVNTSHPERTVSGALGSPAVLEVKPGLLRRMEEVLIDVVVSGEPNPSLVSSLIDVDVISGAAFDWRRDLARTALEALVLALPFGGGARSLSDALIGGALRGRRTR